MPQFFNIDNTWTYHQWVNTGGTRAKKFLQSPEGEFYYFKRSQLKEGKDYTFEFWSEIIAAELGKLLGFNILDYDLAIYGDVAGCICKSMIAPDYEELIEVAKYLQAFSPNYNPTIKEHQTWYTFQLIENSLERVKQKGAMNAVVEVMVLDALIGNSDRHQENMAFISTRHLISELVKEAENQKLELEGWGNRFVMRLLKILAKETDKLKLAGRPIPKSLYKQSLHFSPIYDSGSSLGRELIEEKLNRLLQNKPELEAYINRGKSEIHWEGLKLNHFELLQRLKGTNYRNALVDVIRRLQSKWDFEKIEKLVMQVDAMLPETHAQFAIPLNRKQVILKIITSRFNNTPVVF